MSVRLLPAAQGARVVFGLGASQELQAELSRLTLVRSLLLCTPGRRKAADALASASASVVGVHDGAREHVPKSAVGEAAALASSLNVDSLVSYGGGSAIGLAKAVAAELPVTIVAIPTTYSGSELTEIYGISDGGSKRTARLERVRPRVVLYDPLVTLGLPPDVSATSGGNALAHCVEALWVRGATEPLKTIAEQGCRELARALPEVVARPNDVDARSRALHGSYLGGRALEGGIALHHKLCHLLGGRYGLPHAETHTALLAHVAAFHREHAPDAMARLGRALTTSDPPVALYDLVERLGAATSLRALGLAEQELDGLADRAASLDVPLNPRPLERDALRKLLRDAFEGARPSPGRRSLTR